MRVKLRQSKSFAVDYWRVLIQRVHKILNKFNISPLSSLIYNVWSCVTCNSCVDDYIFYVEIQQWSCVNAHWPQYCFAKHLVLIRLWLSEGDWKYLQLKFRHWYELLKTAQFNILVTTSSSSSDFDACNFLKSLYCVPPPVNSGHKGGRMVGSGSRLGLPVFISHHNFNMLQNKSKNICPSCC